MKAKAIVRIGVGVLAALVAGTAVLAHQGDIHTYDDYTYINEETGTMVRIYVEGDTRFFEANALPDHTTGAFPNPGNPHTISAQDLMLQAPANPELAMTKIAVGLGKFGLAINGVPFEREAAEWYNGDPNSGWQYDAFGGGIQLGFDFNNAHVQPTGLYHYHGIPDVLVAEDMPIEHPELVGFAADGFPIYIFFGYQDPTDANSVIVELQPSYQLKQGTRPGGPGGVYDGAYNEDWEFVARSGDLDECNGRTGITPEYPNGTYYYVLTESFPRIPACWSGTPGEGWVFTRGQGQPAGDSGQQRSGNGERPPQGTGSNPPPRPGNGG